MEGNSPLSGSPALTQHSDVKETLGAQVSEDSAGVRRLNQYAMKQLLGSGSYGNVYEGFDNERHIKVAIKQFSKARLRRNLQTKRGVAGVALRGRMRGRINNAHHVKSASRDDDALGNSIASSISTNSTTSSSSSSSSSSEESPIELVRGELAILKKLDHKNVVKLYEVLDSDEVSQT